MLRTPAEHTATEPGDATLPSLWSDLGGVPRPESYLGIPQQLPELPQTTPEDQQEFERWYLTEKARLRT